MGNTGKVCMALLRCAVISAAHLPESSEVIAEVNEARTFSELDKVVENRKAEFTDTTFWEMWNEQKRNYQEQETIYSRFLCSQKGEA